jgi:hypothetical protein
MPDEWVVLRHDIARALLGDGLRIPMKRELLDKLINQRPCELSVVLRGRLFCCQYFQASSPHRSKPPLWRYQHLRGRFEMQLGHLS